MSPFKASTACAKWRFVQFSFVSICVIGVLALASSLSDTLKLSTKPQLLKKIFMGSLTTLPLPRDLPIQTDVPNQTDTPHRHDSVTLPTTPILQKPRPSVLHFKEKHKRKVVNPHDYRYIHNFPRICKGRDVELVIGVTTRAENFHGRRTIRDTWGDYGKNPDHQTVVMFFLGRPKTKFYQARIDGEAELYGDIIQVDFLDTYRNLTIKTISLLKWTVTYCPNSMFLLKADDDMYINVPRLIKDMRAQFARTRAFIMGRLYSKTAPFRDKDNKWYVAEDEFSDKYYPEYVSGSAYSLTTSAAELIYIESLYTKYFFLEDIYITGMIAQKLEIPRINNYKFNPVKTDPNGCNYMHRISGHKNVPDEIKKIHEELHDPNIQCHFNP